MKIKSIEAIPVHVPLKRTFAIASGAIPSGRNVVIRVQTDSGVEGLGEASPIASTDADTQASIVDVIRSVFSPRLLGRDLDDLPALLYTLDASIPGNYCAKAGLDIALHDLAAKARNVPVWQLLGGLSRSEIRSREVDIWIDTPEAMARSSKLAFESGIRNFEIKIGSSAPLDYERVRAVREAVGPEARLRADCNEGYSIDVASKVLRRLEMFELDYIEQPLPRWDLLGMAKLAANLDTPICADQAAYTPHDVFTVLRLSAADLICIKIARCGLRGARTIEATCEAAGVGCTLGSMLPLGIGAAAIHHFALCSSNIDISRSGVYGSPLDYYEDDIVVSSMLDASGVIRNQTLPGLGVRLDEAKLSRYAR